MAYLDTIKGLVSTTPEYVEFFETACKVWVGSQAIAELSAGPAAYDGQLLKKPLSYGGLSGYVAWSNGKATLQFSRQDGQGRTDWSRTIPLGFQAFEGLQVPEQLNPTVLGALLLEIDNLPAP